MPSHEPFDGTVPIVWKPLSIMTLRWVAARPDDRHSLRRFATWQEAMDYATGKTND